MTETLIHTDNPILKVRDLSISYEAGKYAVKDINADIESKALQLLWVPQVAVKVLFSGHSTGCMNYIPIFRQTVIYFLMILISRRCQQLNCRRKVGMVFQRPNPFPTMNIYDNVIAGYKLNGIKLKRSERDDVVEKALIDVTLWDEVKDSLFKKGTFLSGGQQQRLCIARAIAFNPEVLLLDEPTSALDPVSTAKIEDLLVNFKKDYTILLVTHNMSQAARISDNSMFMYLGELVEYGKTDTMFTNPKDPRTEGYLTGKFG